MHTIHIYVTGRAVAGEDGFESITTRAENYYKRIEWLYRNRGAIVELVRERIVVEEGS